MRLRCPSGVIALMLALALAACGGGGGGGSSQAAAPSAEVWKGVGVAIGSGLPGDPPVLMPEVVVVSANLFRMYYGEGRSDGGWDIWYAESADGLGWIVRGIALAGTLSPSDPEFVIRGASLLHLANGQWRMYYQATPNFDQANPNASRPYFQTMSAISSDGVTFTREGVRISNHQFDPQSVFDQAAHARVIKLDSGTYAAYVSGKLADPNSSGLYLCPSADGLTFQAPTFILAGHDPYIVKLNGQYVLYVDTSTPPNDAFSVEALLVSPDGLTWSPPSTATLEDQMGAQINYGPDVGGVIMPSGKLRLFSNYGVGRILLLDRISPP
jgi:hypothetical protein